MGHLLQEGVVLNGNTHRRNRNRAGVRTAGIVLWPALVLLVLCAITAGAQDPVADFASATEVAEGELTLDIPMGWPITAYRNGSWVPLDLIINNNDYDLTGCVKVTTLGWSGGPQSPIYTAPVESPKGSRKRVRVYCKFQDCSGIRAMLYHKGRPALEHAVGVQPQPIDEEDLLCMVLDEDHVDYGFVTTALNMEEDGIRVHREGVRDADLGGLPNRIQCLDSFDFIIMGKTDPKRIPSRRRDLILRYAAEGGTLIICTGENALRFRGTWIEELAGVRVGSVGAVDEAALAAACFPPAQREGARAGRPCMLAELTPVEPEVQVCGTGPVLATIRPIGSGHVVVLALDVPGSGLHSCPGYWKLWYDLCSLHRAQAEPDYAGAYECLADNLPRATGIRIYPRSAVFNYLAAYFVVAVLLNWLVWSILKRREMAWVCLVLFSIGFTAYAMLYGTSGRAKASELEQFEVIRVPMQARMARVHAFVGLVTARTSRYDFRIANEYALVSEGDPQARNMNPRMQMRQGGRQPCEFIQTSPPRIEQFGIGASEMRLLQTERDMTIPGGIEGSLTLDENGLHGSLVNATGMDVRSPFLLYNGGRFPLRPRTDTWEVSITPPQLNRPPQTDGEHRNPYYGYGRTISAEELKRTFTQTLFANPEFSVSEADRAMGPYLCGWVQGLGADNVLFDEPIRTRFSERFLVADVVVQAGGRPVKTWQSLNVTADGQPLAQRVNPGMPAYYPGQPPVNLQSLSVDKGAYVEIHLPRGLAESDQGDVEIEVFSQVQNVAGEVVLMPVRGAQGWAEESVDQISSQYNAPVTRRCYRISGRRSLVDESGRVIAADVFLRDPATGERYSSGSVRRTGGWVQYNVIARMKTRRAALDEGVWQPWQ